MGSKAVCLFLVTMLSVLSFQVKGKDRNLVLKASDKRMILRQLDKRLSVELSSKQIDYLFQKGLEESTKYIQEDSSQQNLKYQLESYFLITSKDSSKQETHPSIVSSISNLEEKFISDKAIHALNTFSGRWFGLWKEKKVFHKWLKIRNNRSSSTLISNNSPLRLVAYQSVFSGDGFGWNFVIHVGSVSYISGITYHFDQSGNIYLTRPHLGSLLDRTTLVWSTKDHLYFERKCKCRFRKGPHYVIEGVYFKKYPIEEIENFQAVYSRNKLDFPQ